MNMNMNSDRRTAREVVMSATAAAAGALVCLAGIALAPASIALSYLVAYVATVAVVVGMLLLVMIAHVSGGTWFVVLRRRAEGVVGALPLLAVLMLPLLVVPQAFWPWAAPFDALPASLQAAVRPKLPYFHPAFFIARAVAYWTVWLCAGELLRRISRRQDTGDPRASHQRRIVSIAGLPLAGVALAFAAVDWMMSLSPGWSSSIYGVYYFAGAMVGALALVAVIAFERRPAVKEAAPTAEHLHALGKLTLAFVLFWAYLWYAQYFIIWIAGIPEETAWYVARLRAPWQGVIAAVLGAGFAVPLLVLFFRAAKRSFAVMGMLGVWLLAVHYLDVYWLLVPNHRPEWSGIHLLWDLGALALVAGSAAAAALWRHASAPAALVGDPLLAESLRYEAR